MLSYDDGDDEMFFDSFDRFPTDESGLNEAEPSTSGYGLGYEIWANEPRSVEERRRNFLRLVGLSAELGAEEIELDRLGQAVSHFSVPSASDVEEVSDNWATEESLGEANSTSDESNGLPNAEAESPNSEECRDFQQDKTAKKKKTGNWLKRFVNKAKEEGAVAAEKHKKLKMSQRNKRWLELTAPYTGQDFAAHKGAVWTMKFSPDGQYLASGGQDGVVRVWRVIAVDASSDNLTAEGNFCRKMKGGKFGLQRKHPIHASVIIPEKIFRIDECPIQEFHGHSSDVLDLAWSNSNFILSSSTDKTVRLWQLGCHECVNIFRHNNYVTCIQFNPVDDNYFISGSIDGKARIWGVSEKRVVDWTDVRDMITAICYKPDGKGFIVGSITGDCRSYRTSDECMVLDTEINIGGKKKTSGNKITGIKFSNDKPQRVMISSEDSKIRVFDGVDLTHKYKGLPKSGSQTSASFTSGEKHIVSVGDDSRVYIWNYDPPPVPSPKQAKSVQSCEHFFHKGVSVAIPWSGVGRERAGSPRNGAAQGARRVESMSCTRDSDRFSLGGRFSMDGHCRGSATWPEEKLPLWDQCVSGDHPNDVMSETWGLVIVTAGLDGTIRTFHNYGLPFRL